MSTDATWIAHYVDGTSLAEREGTVTHGWRDVQIDRLVAIEIVPFAYIPVPLGEGVFFRRHVVTLSLRDQGMVPILDLLCAGHEGDYHWLTASGRHVVTPTLDMPPLALLR